MQCDWHLIFLFIVKIGIDLNTFQAGEAANHSDDEEEEEEEDDDEGKYHWLNVKIVML